MHCEGKMMALAGYGKPNKHILEKIEGIIPELNHLHYFDSEKILKKEFPEITNSNKNVFEKTKLDFAASVQQLFSEHRVKDISKIITSAKETPDNLVMAGGASLNLDTNTEILKAFSDIKQYIAPCCDDTGQSLGALSILIVQEMGHRPNVKLPYLGMGAESVRYNKDTISKAVDILNLNGIIVLHNGKAEVGPRALGNRSLVARPDNIEVKEMLSEKIKQRESYRPVAPVTIEEKVSDYFIGPKTSPFMLYKYDVIESKRKQLVGAVHHDGSARVQTVTQESNPFLYDLIKTFGDNTGLYVLLNTSLNLRGCPIANTIEDSFKIYDKMPRPKALIYNGNIEKIDF
jgi:carbamoyltransferase